MNKSKSDKTQPVQLVAQLAGDLRRNIGKVLYGKESVIDMVLSVFLARGHVLLEDVPGTGKTLLAKSLASSIGGTFHRIQFTPDLLPSDIVGTSIFRQQKEDFEFRRGPVFTDILLGDELNRATPRTQSALLEAMEERQVTADGESLALPEAFFVMATQNPVEQQGVYPLPEAQLDRFAMRLSVGYPTPDEEELLVSHRASSNLRLPPLPAVSSIEDIRKAQEVVDKIHVDQTVVEYMVKLVLATRKHSDVVLGASPRASLALCKCAQALAAVRGSDFVTPDLIKAIAVPTLAHRLVMEPRAMVTGRTAQAVVQEILKSIPVPLGL